MAGDAAGLELRELCEGGTHVTRRSRFGQPHRTLVNPLVGLDEVRETITESQLNTFALRGGDVRMVCDRPGRVGDREQIIEPESVRKRVHVVAQVDHDAEQQAGIRDGRGRDGKAGLLRGRLGSMSGAAGEHQND